MSVTIVLDGAEKTDIVVHVDPLAELQAFLHGVAHGGHHPRTRDARERIFGSGGQEFLTRMRRYGPFFGTIRARYLLPMDVRSSAMPDLESRFEDLRRLPLERFVALSATALVDQSEVFQSHDPTMEPDVFFRVLARIAQSRVEIGRQLLDDPDRVREGLIALLSDTDMGWFGAEWKANRPLLTHEASELRHMIQHHGVTAIASISEAATIEPDPNRIVFDKINRSRLSIAPNKAILTPSFHGSPHIVIKSSAGEPSVIHYPVLEKHIERRHLVERRLQALQDSSRIEICRTVMRSPKTTADLAAQLQMTEPQASRHLRVLREANLVNRAQHGRYVYYTLNVNVLRNIGDDLLSVLHR